MTAGFLGHQATSKLHWFVLAISDNTSPCAWLELGFQHNILLSFPQLTSKSASCLHHAKERIPLWWFSRVFNGDVAKRRSQSWMIGAWSSSASCCDEPITHAKSFIVLYLRLNKVELPLPDATLQLSNVFVTLCRLVWWLVRFYANPRRHIWQRRSMRECVAPDDSRISIKRPLTAGILHLRI